MRLPGRREFMLDTEVKVRGAGGEPASAACRLIGRLRHFAQTEDTGVERAGIVFAARGHRQLDVMESEDCHEITIPPVIASANDQPRCARKSSAIATTPGSACIHRIERLAVMPPTIPATITHERKNTAI